VADLEQFCEVKTELEKIGLPVNDIPQFAKAMKGFNKFNYSVERVMVSLTNLDSMCTVQAILEKNVDLWNSHLTRSKAEAETLDRILAVQRHKASVYEELDEMSFGISKLRILSDTIKEIAAEEGIPEYVAADNFFRDIAENYERNRYYESRIKKMSAELNSLRLMLSYTKEVAKALSKLILRGYNENHILNFAMILQAHSIDPESFAEDLSKYGTLKEANQGLAQQRGASDKPKCMGTTSCGWMPPPSGTP
jgi:hypothetical protein